MHALVDIVVGCYRRLTRGKELRTLLFKWSGVYQEVMDTMKFQ